MNPERETPDEESAALPRERKLETADVNIDLMLRRCIRKGIQPREFLESSIGASNMVNVELYGQEEANELLRLIGELPDYDLHDPDDVERARLVLRDILRPILELEYEDADIAERIRERQRSDESLWGHAGLFAYEVDDHPKGKALVLHVPPTSTSPGLRELKESLSDIATILEADPSITQVRASSLLLEHPLASRLGFVIDKKSDKGMRPNAHMSSAEFCQRFGARGKTKE